MSMLSRFAATGGSGDPYWSNVSYLLVGNGANGTTTNIVDSSSNNVSTTITGNTVISTTQSKYGSGSVYFDGTGSRVNVNSGSVLNFGTADYTVETWVYVSSVSGIQVILRDNATGAFSLLINGNHMELAASGQADDIIGTTSLTTGNWYYVAVSRSSGTTRLYTNGSLDGSMTTVRNYPSTNPVYIGAIPSAVPLTGYIYDMRITKGVARYTGSTMTVPTAPLPIG